MKPFAVLQAPNGTSIWEYASMDNSLPRTSGIYVIVNTKNGKVYVGKGADIHARWSKHKRLLKANKHYNIHLQRAWNKYGAKVFRFQTLEHCAIEQLDEREKHHIAIYKARGLAYNLTDGGDGMLGNIPTAETRAKLSAANKGKKLPPFSDEHCARISAGNLGKKKSPEAIAKRLNTIKGRKYPPLSDEHKRKIGLAHKGRPKSPEQMAKMTATHVQQWIVTTPDGEMLEVENLKAFCRMNGLDPRHMSNVAHEKEKHHKQWKCRRA